MNSNPCFTVEEATKKIESFCAYQDRCHKEVAQKLRDMGMIPLAIDTIIGQLIQDRFLNEERFARSYARGKFNIKKWGRNRIKRELKLRAIGQYNITAALSEIEDGRYLETLEILAEKRMRQITSEKNLFKKRKKLTDYLLYRGWESHLVYEVSKRLIP